MKQEYSKYTKEDKDVWELLFETQKKNFVGKISELYDTSLNKIKVLNEKEIVRIDELNKILDETGWSIEIVSGLIDRERFFELLAEKKFCASTWIRSKNKIDYLEEPDMFHDIFGHIPMLIDKKYSDFVNKLGKISLNYLDNPEAMDKIQRLYWFTIEFGVIRERGNIVSYGAGIISSSKETNKVFNTEGNFIDYDLETILNKDFYIDDVQNDYFVIDSYNQLYQSLDSLKDLI
jgi:phenylalanine-4-hydroxylase